MKQFKVSVDGIFADSVDMDLDDICIGLEDDYAEAVRSMEIGDTMTIPDMDEEMQTIERIA